MRERAVAFPIVFVAAAMAYSSPTSTAIYCGVLALASLLFASKVEADRVAQAAASVVAMMGGVLVARLTALPIETAQVLSERSLLLGLPMLSIAAVRACLVRPLYGAPLTLLATLVALTAAGRAQTGVVFPAAAALTLAAGLYAFRVSDPTRAPLVHWETRHYAGVAFGATVAVALSGFAVWSLPRVHDMMIARLMARAARTQSGFGNTMTLSAMEGMFQDDAVVLRVRGETPELLRGVVLADYQNGRWEVGTEALVPEVVEVPTVPSRGSIEIEHATRDTRGYFVPLGATDLASSSGFVDRDVDGILRPSASAFAKRLWFRVGDPPHTPPPTLVDLHVSTRIFPELRAIADEWGAAGKPPRQGLKILEERLRRDYRYALEFERTPRVDPVVDFLRRHKEGHCEYFASAFALLARTIRVPARVVAGYRVTERSPFDYFIVRKRNAHSWVEVYIDDHWETWDPTPASEDLSLGPRTSTPWLSALFDGVRTAWEAADDWFGRRSAFELSLALAGLVGALVLLRTLRNRTKGGSPSAELDAPAELRQLTAVLSRVGVVTDRSDTLGSLSMKVAGTEALPSEVRADVATALSRYERLRYGGEGDAKAVLGELGRAAAAARRKPSP